ncbi:unnamed protein product, partial [Meganyctiphanes norvegica]
LMVMILICYQLVLIVVNEHCYQESSLAGSQLYNLKHQGYIKDEKDDSHEEEEKDDMEGVQMKEFKYIEHRQQRRNVFECPHRFKNNYNTARFILGMTAVMLCIYFLLIALMVHGARTQRPNLMAPWLMWTLVHIVFAILTLIGIGRLPPSDVFSELFVLGLLTYFFCVVNSYYHQLREAENSGGRAMVVALSRPDRNNLSTSEMFVTFPSPRKADLPPPYPGMDNPNYNPYPSDGAAVGMEAANYADRPPNYTALLYPCPGVDPPGYGDIVGGASNSLAVSLPPPPAYSFSNESNSTEPSALSPPPPPGFASASQDTPLRAASTRVVASQSITTTEASAAEDNMDNGGMEINMTTAISGCDSDDSGFPGVVSEASNIANTNRNTPGASLVATANEAEIGKEVSAIPESGSNNGKSCEKPSVVSVEENQEESCLRIGFVNPNYEGIEETAAAEVVPPPQPYGDSEDSVNGAAISTPEKTESQTFVNKSNNTSKI